MTRRILVLVAGLPGSGKSTVLARLPRVPDVAVVDSQTPGDALRRLLPRLPYRTYRPLVHLLHRLRIVLVAATGPAVVVVHLPATGRRTRRVLAALAALTRRAAHLAWLEVGPDEALGGQRRRRRVTPGAAFRRKVRRAAALGTELRAGHVPPGWTSATVLDRAGAEQRLAALVAGRAGAVGPAGDK